MPDLGGAEDSLVPLGALAQLCEVRYITLTRRSLGKVSQLVLAAVCNQGMASLDSSDEHVSSVGWFRVETVLPRRLR